MPMLCLVFLQLGEIILVHEYQSFTQFRSVLDWSGKDYCPLMHNYTGAFANTGTNRDVKEIGQESLPRCNSISSSREAPS